MKTFSFLHSKVPYTFMGVDNDYEKARIVFLPVPYDGTTSYQTGARYGPHALIEASRQVETYDEELKADFTRLGLYTAEEIEPNLSGPEATLDRVSQAVTQVIEDRKMPFVIGGEHSLTAGALKALRKAHPKATVLHLDAHPDMRPEYEGTPFNHGCVMRRALDMGFRIVQAGIRAVSAEDADTWKKFGKNAKTFLMREKDSWTPADIVKDLGSEVYVTLDIDVLDSGIMPSTGTPEPGGFSWTEILRLLRKVAQERNIVGMDLMELAPIPGMRAPDYLAAKLAYKMTGYAFEKELKRA